MYLYVFVCYWFVLPLGGYMCTDVFVYGNVFSICILNSINWSVHSVPTTLYFSLLHFVV